MAKNPKRILLAVELSGGPLDGHRDVVPKHEVDLLDVFLFVRETPGEKERCAYGWANRTTRGGRLWVLEFRCVVSRWSYLQTKIDPKS